MILPLFPEEQMRVQRIDKNTLFALKKIFINSTFKKAENADVNHLAAQRIALGMINDIFHNLETLPSNNPQQEGSRNMV